MDECVICMWAGYREVQVIGAYTSKAIAHIVNEMFLRVENFAAHHLLPCVRSK